MHGTSGGDEEAVLVIFKECDQAPTIRFVSSALLIVTMASPPRSGEPDGPHGRGPKPIVVTCMVRVVEMRKLSSQCYNKMRPCPNYQVCGQSLEH